MTQEYPPVPLAPPSPPAKRGATIAFGVLSAVGAISSFVLGWIGGWIFVLPGAVLVLVGIIGAVASAGAIRTRVAILAAIQGVGLALLALAFAAANDRFYLASVVIILIGAIGLIVAAAASGSSSQRIAAPGTQPRGYPPLGYTAEGQPVYPVVGYTSEGAPVTADRLHGYVPSNISTNAMAITALILAFVLTPLAIPFGHVARSQIRRTGEQGAGMALAALIIGYIWVGALVLLGLVGLGVYRVM